MDFEYFQGNFKVGLISFNTDLHTLSTGNAYTYLINCELLV